MRSLKPLLLRVFPQLRKRKGDDGSTNQVATNNPKRKRAVASSSNDRQATPSNDDPETKQSGAGGPENDAPEQVRVCVDGVFCEGRREGGGFRYGGRLHPACLFFGRLALRDGLNFAWPNSATLEKELTS